MNAQQIMQRLASVDTSVNDVTLRQDFTTSSNKQGQRSRVATYQLNRPLALRQGTPAQFALMAYEEFTASGGSPETFSLTYDLIDSGATDTDVVAYVNGTQATPAAVDYSGDSVDLNTSNGDTVGIYYCAADQARVEVEKTAPNGTSEVLFSADIGMLHRRDHSKEPVLFEFNQSQLQGVVPTNFTLDVYVNAPYISRFKKDIDGDGDTEDAVNALLELPAKRARDKVNGLSDLVRQDMAGR